MIDDQERPTSGGSYVRDKDSGALKRVEFTEPAPVPSDTPPDAAAPAPPRSGKKEKP